MSPPKNPREGSADKHLFSHWLNELEARHMEDLTFSEVRRGVQALSLAYVERRKTHRSSALVGRGKRAAFGFFFATLHFLLIEKMLTGLNANEFPVRQIVDLGCGTGVAGAAWALQSRGTASVVGVDQNSWAAGEARWTYQALGLRGSVRRTDLNRIRLPGRDAGILVAFTANELSDESRDRLRLRLLKAASQGATVLVVEPIARRLTPWWNDWVRDFSKVEGVARDWRVPAELPKTLRLMDKGAGLDHKVLTGRSLWVPGTASRR